MARRRGGRGRRSEGADSIDAASALANETLEATAMDEGPTATPPAHEAPAPGPESEPHREVEQHREPRREQPSRGRRIAVVNGPNLNLLGTRETRVYGSTTLSQIEQRLRDLANDLGAQVSCFQSAREGALIEHIHSLRGRCDGIIINAAGYSHTSIALRDALLAVGIPFVEVHISNVYARESFRHTSVLADVARGVIVGFGPLGYELALGALLHG